MSRNITPSKTRDVEIAERFQSMKDQMAKLETMLQPADSPNANDESTDQTSGDEESDPEDNLMVNRVAQPAYVDSCPSGTIACNKANGELCPDSLSTNIFNRDAVECFPRAPLRAFQKQTRAQQQQVHVVEIPNNHLVKIKLQLLRDIAQNAAIINSRLLSISRADVSCSHVNELYHANTPASIEDRRAFCNTLITSDGLTKCEMDAQDKCMARDLAAIRAHALHEINGSEPKHGLSEMVHEGVEKVKEKVEAGENKIKLFFTGITKLFTSKDKETNPIWKLYKNGKIPSFMEAMQIITGLVGIIAAAAAALYGGKKALSLGGGMPMPDVSMFLPMFTQLQAAESPQQLIQILEMGLQSMVPADKWPPIEAKFDALKAKIAK